MLKEMFQGEIDSIFPYGHDENGWCEKLVDNKCSVYESRPTLCNIEMMWQMSGQDKDTYYAQNIEACNSMMDEDGVSKEYRINEIQDQTRKDTEGPSDDYEAETDECKRHE
jgi:Fe-S-cluster containining protein